MADPALRFLSRGDDDDSPEPELRGRALDRFVRLSVIEGLLTETVAAFAGGAVLSAWAVYLRCSPFAIGILMSMPFYAQVLQISALNLRRHFSRRRLGIAGAATSRLLLGVLALLPFVPVPAWVRQGSLIVVAALSAAFAVLGSNAWLEWMCEVIPCAIRGRLFGKRLGVCTLGGAFAGVVSGAVLDRARDHAFVGQALAILALLAAFAGAASIHFLRLQHGPRSDTQVSVIRASSPRSLPAASAPTSWVAALFSDSAVRPVLLYQVAWNGSVGITVSFLGVYMIRDLHMPFALIALHGAALATIRMVAAPLWGRAVDRIGARPVIVACSFGVSVLPLLWLTVRSDFLWPLMLDVAASGVLWGGQGVGLLALPLSVAPAALRSHFLAAFAAAGGIAFAVASTGAGALAGGIPPHFSLCGVSVVPFQLLLVISCVARLGASALATRIVKSPAPPMGEVVETPPTLEPTSRDG